MKEKIFFCIEKICIYKKKIFSIEKIRTCEKKKNVFCIEKIRIREKKYFLHRKDMYI